MLPGRLVSREGCSVEVEITARRVFGDPSLREMDSAWVDPEVFRPSDRDLEALYLVEFGKVMIDHSGRPVEFAFIKHFKLPRGELRFLPVILGPGEGRIHETRKLY